MELHGILLTVGIILASGALGGAAARLVRLPSLTGYLAAGVLLGRHGMDQFNTAHIEQLSQPVNDLAMALVLFVLGGHFRFDRLRGRMRPMLGFSLVEAGLTFLLVAICGRFALGAWPGALLLGSIAVAVAPATTLLVLQEYRAKGKVTDTLTLATALSNLITILLFESVMLVLAVLGGAVDASAAPILWDVLGSLLTGLIAGHALILMQERIGRENYSLPLLTILLLTIGLCQFLGIPHMLAFLVTGSVVANRSRFFDPLTAAMGTFAQPAYVAFFVLSGLHLDFAILLEHAPTVGLYVAARTLGKIWGSRIGVRLSGIQLKDSRGLGLGLLCQAGAAIALAGVVGRYNAVLAEQLLNIVLGAVVVFELVGPLLVRRLAVHAGEVRMSALLVHSTAWHERPSWWRALRRLLRGRKIRHTDDPDRLTVARLTHHGSPTLHEKAGLDEILHFADHSPFNHFPVVSEDGRLAGLIPLSDLSDLAYDPMAAGLVIAVDVATLSPEEASLPLSASLEQARLFFQSFQGNTAAVVESRGSSRFVGMIERAEVLRLARTLAHPTR